MWRTIYTGCALLISAGLSGCGKPAQPGPVQPNVVVIVIDTLRADHLACYGYSENPAPFLGELAKKSVIFDMAIAPSSWTAPSTASLFTSTYPNQHGVLLGDRYYRDDDQEHEMEPPPSVVSRIPKALQTIPELMRERGYRTFGISDNYFISAVSGFGRGFDRFIQFNYNGADAVNKLLMRWKDDVLNGKGPFFLYVHYVDPHWPYHVRHPWYRESGKESSSERAYDSEIGYVDDRIRKLFDAYGLRENTMVIITADHGEEFGDHGGEGHRFKLYQELIHVPLMIYFPPAGIEPHRVKEDVSLMDILPTLRELAGAGPGDQDMGVSLMPVVKNVGRRLGDRNLFSIRTKEADVRLAEKRAVVHGTDKLILSSPENTREYYDLAKDPHERINLAGKEKGLVEELENVLDEFENTATIYPYETVDMGTLDPDLKEQLRSLGYLH